MSIATPRAGAMSKRSADHSVSRRGKSAMFITHLNSRDLSKISFYSTIDTRVRFFNDLGLQSPKGVVEGSLPGRFSGSVCISSASAE